MAWALVGLWTAPIFAASSTQEQGAAVLAEDAVQGETPADTGEAADYTIFNDVRVPPMLDIEGDKFDETVKDGYW